MPDSCVCLESKREGRYLEKWVQICQEKMTDKIRRLLISYQKCNNQGKIHDTGHMSFHTRQEKTASTKSSNAVRRSCFFPSLKTISVQTRHLSFSTGWCHRLELVGQCLFWETAWTKKVLSSTKGQQDQREPGGALPSAEDNNDWVENNDWAAYALALPATLRTILCCALVLTLVIAFSELWLFVIFNSECSTATKFRSLLFA